MELCRLFHRKRQKQAKQSKSNSCKSGTKGAVRRNRTDLLRSPLTAPTAPQPKRTAAEVQRTVAFGQTTYVSSASSAPAAPVRSDLVRPTRSSGDSLRLQQQAFSLSASLNWTLRGQCRQEVRPECSWRPDRFGFSQASADQTRAVRMSGNAEDRGSLSCRMRNISSVALRSPVAVGRHCSVTRSVSKWGSGIRPSPREAAGDDGLQPLDALTLPSSARQMSSLPSGVAPVSASTGALRALSQPKPFALAVVPGVGVNPCGQGSVPHFGDMNRELLLYIRRH